MSTKRVTLRRCNNVIEADTLRIRLAAAGIDAVVQGSEGVTALGHIGGAAGYPQVDVPSEDFARAVMILRADESASQHTKPWICSRCDERNEAPFDLCWSCQKSRDEHDRSVPTHGYRRTGDPEDIDRGESPERQDLIPNSLYLAVEIFALLVIPIVAIAIYALAR